MKISEAWNGYGSGVFLELGLLSPTGHRHGGGEACIHFGWDWRASINRQVIVGSSSNRRLIADFLDKLTGEQIDRLELWHAGPELRICLSNGVVFETLLMVTGDPEWSIRLLNTDYIVPREGKVVLARSDSSDLKAMSPQDALECDFSKGVAGRWRARTTESDGSRPCRQCRYFVRLDASYYFFDYGVCANSLSEMDGKISRVDATCSGFEGVAFPSETSES
ncbi:MAG: DUF3027 domain-containing protein [Verrucomicrobiaceae bacterium]|nr:DUF3027 domain-containing protein [Verrucomicrobiaceae bacterium]